MYMNKASLKDRKPNIVWGTGGVGGGGEGVIVRASGEICLKSSEVSQPFVAYCGFHAVRAVYVFFLLLCFVLFCFNSFLLF